MARHRRFRLAAVVFVLIGTLATALPSMGAAQSTGTDTEGAAVSASAPDFNGPVGPTFTIPRWSDTGQWDLPQYYSTIQLADVDGDGGQELLGRSSQGMELWTFVPENGQWQALAVEGPFADSGGWNSAPHYSTIQTGDIDGDGADELLGRSPSGMETYKWDKDKGEWTHLRAANPAFTDAGSWNHPQYYSTIQTGDIDGDGADELMARSAAGLNTYKWDKDELYWRTLRGSDPGFTDAGGWARPQHYATIQTGDIDGDGSEELLARGPRGMDTYGWDKDKREWTLWRVENPAWSDAAGWKSPQYYSTIQTGDIDGDGADEILGRGGTGMGAYEWTDGTFARMNRTDNPRLSDHLWKHKAYYSTIQTGDIDGDGQAELVARGTWGVRTWHFATEKHRPNPDTPLHDWGRYLPYGFPEYKNDPGTGGRDGDIYNAINKFLTVKKSPSNPDATVRGGYTTIFGEDKTPAKWLTLLIGACKIQEPETNPPTYIDCQFDVPGGRPGPVRMSTGS